jgi:CHASE3 domain sensor protein
MVGVNVKDSSLSAKLVLGFGLVIGLLVVMMVVYQMTITNVRGGYGDLLAHYAHVNADSFRYRSG